MSEKKEKMWGGRFSSLMHPLMESFGSSVDFDWRLASYDIRGSIAHAKMLALCGIISRKDAEKITIGLKKIDDEIKKGKFPWDEKLEDVHTNIESALRNKIGELADQLHTARSRNDQVVLDLRMCLREEVSDICEMIRESQKSIMCLIKKNSERVIPGYTHLQRAQPVLLAHHLMAYMEMLERDYERFQQAAERINSLPLGSCAMAGTTFQIDRNAVARELGFKSISQNSMDGVSDRDFVIETASAIAILGTHLSRLSEEMILWSGFEFGFIELPDSFSTGSSAMPQKKNPDVFELIRGKSGRLTGNLVTLLTVMKGLPLTYNRDLQEDKEPIFDSVDTIKSILAVLICLLPELKIKEDRLKEEEDYTSSMDLAEYLVRKGTPFRQAHRIVGQMVRYCIEKNKSFKDFSLDEAQQFSKNFEKDFKDLLGWKASIQAKKSLGSTNPELVKKQIKRWENQLKII